MNEVNDKSYYEELNRLDKRCRIASRLMIAVGLGFTLHAGYPALKSSLHPVDKPAVVEQYEYNVADKAKLELSSSGLSSLIFPETEEERNEREDLNKKYVVSIDRMVSYLNKEMKEAVADPEYISYQNAIRDKTKKIYGSIIDAFLCLIGTAFGGFILPGLYYSSQVNIIDRKRKETQAASQ